MTVGIVIIAHDKVGTSIRDTAVSMVEDCPVKIESLEVYKENDPDEFLKVAKNVIEKCDTGNGVLILTDLYGATPSNVTTRLDAGNNIKIISGLNLPMLIRTINYFSLELDELAEKVLEGGKNGIMICNGAH